MSSDESSNTSSTKKVGSEQRRFRRCVDISTAISGALKPICNKRGIDSYNVVIHWNKIIGEKFAQFCVPVKIVYSGSIKKHVLVVKVTTPAFILHIQALEQNIIRQVNLFIGYEKIGKIKIISEG